MAKILFVDDDRYLLFGLVRSLRECPWELHQRNSARAALDFMADTDIDVVISDQRMPGMTGMEFLTEVRQRWPLTLRVLHTSSAQGLEEELQQGLVHTLIAKPCRGAELACHLTELVQVRRSIQRWAASPGVRT